MGKTEIISSKIRNETRVLNISTLTQQSLGIPSQSNKTGKRNERNINRKEVKLSLFADEMILHLKNLKNSTKKTA
jgi:hypothetical protein